ncbi:MAG: flagellar hook protein FlgE [Candidatus Anaerobiospirillum pullicola]|uniref:Flagellar hook protein FlgE n=1 Tax=Candidatus Anaerobiospirillum pullicola TaxID=2838451 RepID=A0A948TH36_9GAMM|nr:flagellar hook protein FlgE [Candidatus Anaerobiospirillum pullicola]
MFGVSVSGIKNSQKHLDVTSNNIANANSYGFKKSRAEFADMYSSSLYTSGKTAVGLGVQNSVVSQQFSQGALSGDTGNGLDMAIQGEGFFVLSPQGSDAHTYTRNGAFHTDNEGFIVTAQNDYLQGWPVNADGTSSSLDLNATQNIQVPEDTGDPKESNSIGISVNLPADKSPVDNSGLVGKNWGNYAGSDGANQGLTANDVKYGRDIPYGNGTVHQYFTSFDPSDSSTFTNTTSQTVHDSLGRAHTLTYYFINLGPKEGATPDTDSNTTVWAVVPFLDGQAVDVAPSNNENPTLISSVTGNNANSNYFGFTVEFDNNGQMIGDSTVPSNVTFVNHTGDETTGLSSTLRAELLGTGNQTTPGGTQNVIDKTFLQADGSVVGDGSLFSAMGAGSNPSQVLALDLNATQFGSSKFSTSNPTNDGYATGELTGVSISEDGIIYGEYSNGQIQAIAIIAMADFTNTQGLTKIGDTQWKESADSGPAIPTTANTGSTGSILGSNLELSNVDLTSELVELITAQRNYQANAQSLQIQNTVMDSILNIR